ncbi:MAG: Na(+)-translocating NADH-quinone reductase subunit C [Acidiferrobacterales bacterium]
MSEDDSQETLRKKDSGWLEAIRAMPNDSTQKTLIVAVALSLVCSVLVASAAVLLKPLQEQNEVLDKKKNILAVAGLLKEDKSIDEQFKQVEAKVVDLASGEYVDTIDPAAYDARKAAKDPGQSVAIPSDRDVAGIKTRAKHATVYLVKKGDQIERVILPIHGTGLFSTLYGFIALEGDANTVYGLSFYDHGETPGLGGEVDNPKWRSLWSGKIVYDEKGALQIEVVKGRVDSSKPEAKHQVDGLSGATLTSNGVTNMLVYWLSEDGFAPFLAKIRPQLG